MGAPQSWCRVSSTRLFLPLLLPAPLFLCALCRACKSPCTRVGARTLGCPQLPPGAARPTAPDVKLRSKEVLARSLLTLWDQDPSFRLPDLWGGGLVRSPECSQLPLVGPQNPAVPPGTSAGLTTVTPRGSSESSRPGGEMFSSQPGA